MELCMHLVCRSALVRHFPAHVPQNLKNFRSYGTAFETMEHCYWTVIHVPIILLQISLAFVFIHLVQLDHVQHGDKDNDATWSEYSKNRLPRIRYYDTFNVIVHPNDLQEGPSVNGLMKNCFDMTIFGRNMTVQCKSRVNTVFTKNITLVMTSPHRASTHDVWKMLEGAIEGKVLGDLDSEVHGHLLDGTFEGVLTIDTKTIYVERADKFFGKGRKRPFNSIAYRRGDVRLCDNEDSDDSALCQIDDRGVIQRILPERHLERYKWQKRPYHHGPPYYRRKHRTPERWRPTGHEGQSICHLQIIVDHEYFRNVALGTLQRAVIDVQLVMAEVDRIFRKEDFDNDGIPDMIGVKVAAIEVVHNPSGKGFYGKKYPFHGHYRPDEFLRFYTDVESLDHSKYCLGGVFTYRNFGTTLGLAAIPQPIKDVVGGICFKDRTVYGSSNSFFVTAFESRSRSPIPRALLAITVSHEIGHGFGASHDDDLSDRQCFPSNPSLRFLMASWAPKIINKNTRSFSKCSRRLINAILRYRGHCLH